jgi:hypothetical protein
MGADEEGTLARERPLHTTRPAAPWLNHGKPAPTVVELGPKVKAK